MDCVILNTICHPRFHLYRCVDIRRIDSSMAGLVCASEERFYICDMYLIEIQ